MDAEQLNINNSQMVEELQLYRLAPSSFQLDEIHYSPHQIKIIFQDSSGQSIRKRIFFHTHYYDPQERQVLQQFKTQILKQGHKLQPDHILLRFVYAGRFDMDQIWQRYKVRLEWKEDPVVTTPTAKCFKLLKEGIIYVFGRSYKLHPIVVVNARKLNLKEYSKGDYMTAIDFLLETVIRWMFVPQKVETWIIMLDIDNAGIFDIDVRAGTTLFLNMSRVFPTYMQRIFLINPSSVILKVSQFILNLLDDFIRRKVQIITQENWHRIRQVIPEDQLQMKYGGCVQNESEFWPISNRFAREQELSFHTVVNNEDLSGGIVKSIVEQVQSEQKEVQEAQCKCILQ